MRKILLLWLVGMFNLAASLHAQDRRLSPALDANSILRHIEWHLRESHQMVVVEKGSLANMHLNVPMNGAGLPSHECHISAKAGASGSPEVWVRMLTYIRVSREGLDAAAARLPDGTGGVDIRVDKDGEVVLTSSLGLPAGGMDTEEVYNLVIREEELWRSLWPDLVDKVDNR